MAWWGFGLVERVQVTFTRLYTFLHSGKAVSFCSNRQLLRLDIGKILFRDPSRCSDEPFCC